MYDLNLKVFNGCKSNVRYVIQQGGTRAGKTYTILYYLLLLASKHRNKVISIVSESLPHLKQGCIRFINSLIQAEGWRAYFEENKSNHSWYAPHTQTIIECFPASEPDKLRGSERDVLFINECNRVPYDSFDQLSFRTKKKIILDFNPVQRFWVHNKLMLEKVEDKDYKFIKSTYLDNITHIPKEQLADIESHKTNPNWWKVFGEGDIGSLEGLIFTNWTTVNEMPGNLLGYGIDFGFVNSSTAIVQVNECNGELYVKELFYEKGASNEKIITFVKSKGIDLRAQAIADSAEPKTIDYLFKQGWTGLKPCIKGQDSVEHGIGLLLERKINIHKDSVNLIKEFTEYMWDSDKEGKPLNKPIKANDHAIDALRYLYSYPKKRKLLV